MRSVLERKIRYRLGVPPAATALYSASLHRAAAARRLVGWRRDDRMTREPESGSGPKVIARSRDGVGLRPCGGSVALL